MTFLGFPRILLAASLLALALGGCSPLKHSHGYAPRADELDKIEAGVDSRETVRRKLGLPSTIGSFDDNEWYYISVQSEQYAFFEPEVTDQKVVTVSFDEFGIVNDVGRYGLEDGRVVDLVTRTTPTNGRKLTLLQQIFQNVGRFNNAPKATDPRRNLPGG